MIPFKLSTKWFTLEVYRRGIVFTIASLLLTSGLALCNEEIIIALISIVNKNVFKQDSDNYSLLVGVFLILISLFLFYLLIINWRKEIYTTLFYHIRKAVDGYGTAWRARTRHFHPERLRPLHESAHEDYKSAFNFLRDNQTLLDTETYEKSWELLDKIGEEIIELDVYIKAVENKDANYNPDLANKETTKEVGKISKMFKDFVELIKEKEKYKISQ